MHKLTEPFVWFPAIRTGSGADVFTERLVDSLVQRGVRAQISWLPHRAEFLPWSVARPQMPAGVSIVQVNTWLHHRFIPSGLPVVATMLHCVLDPALKPYKTVAQSVYHQFWVRPLEKMVLAGARRVVAISAYTEKSMREIYATGPSEPIGIGIDLVRFSPGGRSQPHEPFRLLYVGNWSARKGADLLIPIMDALGQNFELWVLAGLRAREISFLRGNIRQIPKVPDTDSMVALYRNCDALLFPSRLEGFGLVAQEAQACGLPVIVSESSSLPEVVKQGETGFLCRKDCVEDFVSAARFLANDLQRWRAMGAAARAHAEESFSLDVMVDKYKAVYRSVLEDRA